MLEEWVNEWMTSVDIDNAQQVVLADVSLDARWLYELFGVKH